MSCQPVSGIAAKIGVPKEAPEIGAVTGIIGDGGMVLCHVVVDHILTHHVTGHVCLLSAGIAPAVFFMVLILEL